MAFIVIQDKEKESWEAASQALKTKLELAESNCIRSEIEVAKMRSIFASLIFLLGCVPVNHKIFLLFSDTIFVFFLRFMSFFQFCRYYSEFF